MHVVLDGPSPEWPAQLEPSNASQSQLPVDWHDPFPHLEPFLMANTWSEPMPAPAPSWISDMELMHHYDMSASYTLPGSVELRHIHQVEYVRLALQDEALMHQLLAVSAFHLAFQNPDKRHDYSTRGLQHQTEAARGLRTRLEKITFSTCHACFVAGMLMMIGSFASLAIFHDAKGGQRPGLGDLIDVFHVIRGMYAVLDTFEDDIRQGPVAQLLHIRVYNRRTPRLDSVVEELLDFTKIIRVRPRNDPTRSRLIEKESLGLIRVVEHSVKYSPAPYEWRIICSWAIQMSPGYLRLLAREDEMALALLARCCVVLYETQSVAWYTSGWGASVMRDLERILAAQGTMHADLIAGPARRVLGTGEEKVTYTVT